MRRYRLSPGGQFVSTCCVKQRVMARRTEDIRANERTDRPTDRPASGNVLTVRVQLAETDVRRSSGGGTTEDSSPDRSVLWLTSNVTDDD